MKRYLNAAWFALVLVLLGITWLLPEELLWLAVKTVLLVLVILLLVRQNRTVRDQEAEFDRLAEELRRQQTVSAGELSRLKMELDDSVGRSTERMAKVLLDEFRGGKLGRFTLELPEDMA